MIKFIDTLLQRGYLEDNPKKGILLGRPAKIRMTKLAIDTIKATYRPNYEQGGLLLMQPSDKPGFWLIDQVLIVPNRATVSTAYTPDPAVFNAAINSALNSGLLPLTFHTHPTNIGHSIYDHKKQNFYVKSSKPDRAAAQAGTKVIDNKLLLLPEAIAVLDTRFDTGFKISFFEGGILPPSYAALTTTQIAASVVAAASLLFFGKPLLFGLGAVFVAEEARRPIYTNLSDGSLIVDFMLP